MTKKIIFLIIAFSVCMTNIGLVSDLGYTFSCAQYYFDYLVFAFLGYLIFKLCVFSLKIDSSSKYANISIILAVIVGAFIFNSSYATITGCNFNTVLFVTSKTPLLGTYAASLLFLIPSFEQNKTEVIWVKTINGSSIKLNISELVCLEYRNEITRLYLNSSEIILTSGTLKSIKKLIPEKNFYQVNRNNIVQKKYIQRVESNLKNGLTLVLLNNREVNINKNRSADFKKWFSI